MNSEGRIDPVPLYVVAKNFFLFNHFLSDKPKCMFGLRCYRRNPSHFESFLHPHLQTLIDPENVQEQIAKLVLAGADESTVRDQVEFHFC
jgi:hypothetical protein